MFGVRLEFFSCGRVRDRPWQLVFGDWERDAWPGAADGGHAAGFVLLATDRL